MHSKIKIWEPPGETKPFTHGCHHDSGARGEESGSSPHWATHSPCDLEGAPLQLRAHGLHLGNVQLGLDDLLSSL